MGWEQGLGYQINEVDGCSRVNIFVTIPAEIFFPAKMERGGKRGKET
jgi:hypothetical protein